MEKMSLPILTKMPVAHSVNKSQIKYFLESSAAIMAKKMGPILVNACVYGEEIELSQYTMSIYIYIYI
jgi:hypothetical protein